MMHRLTMLRKGQQKRDAEFQGKPLVRPIFTGTARKGYTPSDLEALETVALVAHNPDGSFVTLPGYDDIDDYL